MAVEIRVPTLGESVLEATIGRWLKQEGEPVAIGEPLVELETDKVNTELPADDSGVLERIMHQEGETVRPGDVLGLIAAGPAAEATPGSDGHAAAQPSAKSQQAAPEAPASPPDHARISPVAQRVAEELHVDVARVPGTGPGGRVTREDIEAYAEASSAPAPRGEEGMGVREDGSVGVSEAGPPPPESPTTRPPEPPTTRTPEPATTRPPGPPRPETRQRLSRRRLTIARRLVEAQRAAAMLTTFNEIDMSAVVALRKRRRESFKERYGVSLGYTSFFTRAVVAALKESPELNAELQDEELVLKRYYDIGIAIGDPEGLVVPVIRDADRLTFAALEQAIAGFVEKAQNRALAIDDLQGGTFTITNGGVFGSLLSTPILNAPQVGILGMHKIEDRPVAVDGEVAIRPMMYVALSYDHRVVDGRQAVQFLTRVKELLEDPGLLLIEG
jgi:2-oxoglutarate dehydrogenase E2 component (dihydrolipoamide succinyltransferase)